MTSSRELIFSKDILHTSSSLCATVGPREVWSYLHRPSPFSKTLPSYLVSLQVQGFQGKELLQASNFMASLFGLAMSGLSTLEYSCVGTQSTSTSFTHGLWAECKIPRHSRLKTQQTMWSIEQVKVSWILGASPRLPRKRSRCLPNEDSPNLAVRPQGSWKRRGSSTDGVFPRNPSKEQSSTPAWTFLQALDTRNLAGIQPCCGTRKTIPALDPGDVWQKIEM